MDRQKPMEFTSLADDAELAGISPSTHGGTMAGSRSQQIRRRNRMITSCLECRRRKLKCDKSHPCTNCTKAARDCVFLAPALDSASQHKLTEIKDKVGFLERSLEEDVARRGYRLVKEEDDSDADRADIPADEQHLEPTPLAVSDAVFDGEGDDDFLDLGIRFGKMRVGERIGGFVRPKIAEELDYAIKEVGAMTGEANAPSGGVFRPESMEQYLRPGPGFIAPAPTLFFGGVPGQSSLMSFLPSKMAADRLIEQYMISVHPMCRCVHRPTFERQYANFWGDVSVAVEPAFSVQALVFAAMLSGVVSVTEQAVLDEFGVEKPALVDTLRQGTEMALAKANFLRSTKMETLQAFVMYLIPLCRDEVSRAHSALVATAIRVAQCMGLHRDGQNYGLSPVEIHVRRLIWHQVSFLDLRTCEAQGPAPIIHSDEYDTKIPYNLDDADVQLQQNSEKWTDATFSIIRFECTEIHRVIWTDRPRLEKKKISLTHTLAKIEAFRKKMDERVGKILNPRIPIQKCARVVLVLMISRLYVMVLHRYLLSAPHKIPDRFRELVVNNALGQVECAIQLDTEPALAPWAWYLGALQQYHSAFLLLNVVSLHPEMKQADRIWTVCDYVFEADPAQPREEKTRALLEGVRDRSFAYRTIRKMKTPTDMEQRLTNLTVLHEQQRPEDKPSSGEEHRWLGNPDENLLRITTPSSINTASMSAITPEAMPLPSTFTGNMVPFYGPNTPSIVAGGPSPQGQTNMQDDMMADIDWNEWDKLFPPDTSSSGSVTSSSGMPAGYAMDEASTGIAFTMSSPSLDLDLDMGFGGGGGGGSGGSGAPGSAQGFSSSMQSMSQARTSFSPPSAVPPASTSASASASTAGTSATSTSTPAHSSIMTTSTSPAGLSHRSGSGSASGGLDREREREDAGGNATIRRSGSGSAGVGAGATGETPTHDESGWDLSLPSYQPTYARQSQKRYL
ncbi:MAG: hypothetical protein M1838_000666 [Thelocarpon superellum]|nr:MAG: hypothetical protein M1838_000666 [Thelocarpon superellum]